MAIKYCWATNRRGSSLKGVMKLKEIGQNAVVCTTEKEPELCDGWLIPGRHIPWFIYLLICVLCLPVMIHLSLSSGSFSVPQTTGSFRQSRQAGSPFSLEPACPGPHLFCNFLLYFCRSPCFPDSSPCILFICLLARSVCCFACAVSWATWLLFSGVPARCVALRVRCPGPLGSCSPVCPLRPLLYSCGVLGHLAPVHRCTRLVCCVACADCPGPLGSCSPLCPLGVLRCVWGVLGHLAPVHRCARSVCCVVCAVSLATWLLFTGVLALCAVLWVARGVLLCGASLRGAHSSIQTAAVRSRQGLDKSPSESSWSALQRALGVPSLSYVPASSGFSGSVRQHGFVSHKEG